MRSFLLLLAPACCFAQGAGIDFRTESLPVAFVHKPYTPPPLAAAGGGRCLPNVLGFSIVKGAPPPGVSLSAAGFFSGTPRDQGVYSFRIRAQNECVSYTREFTLRVEGPPLLEMFPDRIEFRYQTGGTLPESQMLRVSANTPDLAYAVEAEGASWLEAVPLRGRTPPEGTALRHDAVELRVDPAKLQPGEYRARVRAEAWQAGNAPSVWVVLKITGRNWE